MAVLEMLDATRICSRWSPENPDAWALPVPVPPRPDRSSAPTAYSWRALIRNPQALVLTGVVGTLVAMDSAVRIVLPVAARR